jgi:hypothetical protein
MSKFHSVESYTFGGNVLYTYVYWDIGTEQFLTFTNVSRMKRSTLIVYQNSPWNQIKVILTNSMYNSYYNKNHFSDFNII